MDLIVEPDIYSPSIDDIGNYIDKVPSFTNLKNGLRCSCGSRKDKIYDTHSMFYQHTKTKCHERWLSQINLNKSNYYVENIKLNDIINNQKIIIAKLEKSNNNKIMTIDYLTEQLNNKNANCKITHNLLDFD